MLSNWFNFKPKHPTATLTAIYIATAAGEPMRAVDSAEAVEGRGLQGDRYCAGTGHWQKIEGCQLTLMTAHELLAAKHKTTDQLNILLEHGGHRRNLVIDGLKLKHLNGKSFRIGSAIFRYDKPRPPCGYIDQVSSPGMGRALSHNSGICIKVISSGRLAVGDSITVLDEA